MDYTKDAILIEGLRSEENARASHGSDENTYLDGDGKPNHQQMFGTLSTIALMNGSDLLEKKAIMSKPDLGSFLLMSVNGSSSLPPGFPSASSPSIYDEQGFDDANDTTPYIPMSMRPETYIVPVLFAIIFIIGVIGNGTLIVIFIKHRSMRNVPNMFIVSLAIGDLLVILFCVPFTSTVYTVDSWPYGLVVCKFSEFIKDLSVGVSVFTLTALSADRYFAIVDPMRKLTGRRATRITIISIFGIWVLSVLVALPSALYSYIRVFPEYEEGEEVDPNEIDDGRTFQVCYPYPKEFGHTYAQVMVMFHFLVYYAVPLLFIATFYIIMARHLVLSTRNMPGEAQGQAKQIQARKKVAKMILSFVLIFTICFFPHHLFLLFFYFYPDSENSFNAFWNICRIVGFCLSFMNSCINPITLYCVSGTFRKQFNDHLFCCFCDESGNRPGRNGRLSMGGTLAGGGGGHGGGLCAGCVSLSGNHGQLYGNDSRFGNGSLGRGGNGRIHRGSTWENSDRMISKRKSTWETQTTVVNHRVLNNGANIHVNLCNEHEQIPLKCLRHNAKLAVVEAGERKIQSSTKIISPVQKNGSDSQSSCLYSHVKPSGSPVASLLAESSHGRMYNRGSMSAENGTCISPKDNLLSDSDAEAETMLERTSDNTFSAHELKMDEKRSGKYQHNHNLHHHNTRRQRPSLIEEESSCCEQENCSVSSNKSSRQLSPGKAYSKVGEIISKLSSKYSNSCNASPVKILSGHGSAENSSPSASSPTKVALNPAVSNLQEGYGDDLLSLSCNNNNYTNSNGHHIIKERIIEETSPEECTMTSFVGSAETETLGLSNGGSIIECYN